MTRILVAPDKFKGSLTAVEVADAVRRGIEEADPDAEVVCLPVADGGDGTLDAVVAAGFERVPATATGPTGEAVDTAYAVRGDTAAVEMAAVCGLAQLPGGVREPRTATSRGTGELVAAALERGVSRVVLGIGGSASTDGGAGMLQALGVSLRDGAGREVPPGGAGLERLTTVDVRGLHPALDHVEVEVACDVDNPLTGPLGAAAVYGPQKGATAEDVRVLDANLARFADLVADRTGEDHRDDPGAGAAGGVGFAALAVLGATLRPGIDLLLEMLDFREHLREADLVVVGEGSLDEQTLHGKAPMGVASVARGAGVRVVAVCGRRLLTDAQLKGAGIEAAYACTDLEPDPRLSMTQAAVLLRRIGRRLAEEKLPAD